MQNSTVERQLITLNPSHQEIQPIVDYCIDPRDMTLLEISLTELLPAECVDIWLDIDRC
jgi:hypothetical protein